MIKVYYCTITDGCVVDEQRLSDYRRARLAASAREEDRRRSMAAEWLLIYAAEREGLQAPLGITVGEHGKPLLDGLHFSLSHSGDCVACAVSDQPVGLDIQQQRTVGVRLVERIANPDDTDAEPLALWCDKEAVLKLLGCGLTRPMSSVAVRGDSAAAEDKQMCIFRRAIDDYRLSVASFDNQTVELFEIKN
jgi:4'-phosphopantetheinyl transferase